MKKKSLDTAFRATKLEFILLARDDNEDMVDLDSDEHEWEIPDQEVFDEVVSAAVYQYTVTDTMRIKSLAWSSTGWDTGVGIVAITTDDLQLVEEFRDAVVSVEHEGQRFITMPKQMLLKKYALTIYFGRHFHRFETPKLMDWLGVCNNLRGELELVETRYFSKNHDNPRRRAASIVAFEGNQESLDSLHSFPKDYPFNIMNI